MWIRGLVIVLCSAPCVLGSLRPEYGARILKLNWIEDKSKSVNFDAEYRHDEDFISLRPVVPRGGSSAVSKNKTSRRPAMKVTYTLLGSVLVVLIYQYRSILCNLFNKEVLQAKVLEILSAIKTKGNLGVAIYVFGMALWELGGLSTIPVETAAGMAFGYPTGFLASSTGKLLGASAAFFLGRYFLREWIHEKVLKGNAIMRLIDDSVEAHPFRVAICLKYSVFPEFIKNFGSSLFSPIRYWMFLVGTIAHGCPFSMLWTLLGQDAARRLADDTLRADKPLQLLIWGGMILGFFLSPALMAWWVRDMRYAQQKRKNRCYSREMKGETGENS